ncbi:hypothetical protein V8C86DRAFT_3096908 [Haematococcus lacustris]
MYGVLQDVVADTAADDEAAPRHQSGKASPGSKARRRRAQPSRGAAATAPHGADPLPGAPTSDIRLVPNAPPLPPCQRAVHPFFLLGTLLHGLSGYPTPAIAPAQPRKAGQGPSIKDWRPAGWSTSELVARSIRPALGATRISYVQALACEAAEVDWCSGGRFSPGLQPTRPAHPHSQPSPAPVSASAGNFLAASHQHHVQHHGKHSPHPSHLTPHNSPNHPNHPAPTSPRAGLPEGGDSSSGGNRGPGSSRVAGSSSSSAQSVITLNITVPAPSTHPQDGSLPLGSSGGRRQPLSGPPTPLAAPTRSSPSSTSSPWPSNAGGGGLGGGGGVPLCLEVLLPADLGGRSAWGQATFYVAHPWSGSWEGLVACLLQHYSNLPEVQRSGGTRFVPVYYWLDVFAVPQFERPSHEYKHRAEEVLASVIAAPSCRAMLLAASHWAEPAALSRAWCLYELWLARSLGQELQVLLMDELPGGSPSPRLPLHLLLQLPATTTSSSSSPTPRPPTLPHQPTPTTPQTHPTRPTSPHPFSPHPLPPVLLQPHLPATRPTTPPQPQGVTWPGVAAVLAMLDACLACLDIGAAQASVKADMQLIQGQAQKEEGGIPAVNAWLRAFLRPFVLAALLAATLRSNTYRDWRVASQLLAAGGFLQWPSRQLTVSADASGGRSGRRQSERADRRDTLDDGSSWGRNDVDAAAAFLGQALQTRAPRHTSGLITPGIAASATALAGPLPLSNPLQELIFLVPNGRRHPRPSPAGLGLEGATWAGSLLLPAAWPTGTAGVAALAPGLQGNSCLTALTLSGHPIGGEGAGRLAEALQAAPCAMKSLLLRDCGIDSRAGAALGRMLAAASSVLTVLDLGRNPGLGHEGCCHLATGLASNSSLRQLRLDNCCCTTEAAAALAHALMQQSHARPSPAQHPTAAPLGASLPATPHLSFRAASAATTAGQSRGGGQEVRPLPPPPGGGSPCRPPPAPQHIHSLTAAGGGAGSAGPTSQPSPLPPNTGPRGGRGGVLEGPGGRGGSADDVGSGLGGAPCPGGGLQLLDLRQNEVGAGAAAALAAALAAPSGSTLQQLLLGGNLLETEGALALAAALSQVWGLDHGGKGRCQLQRLDLSDNGLALEAGAAFGTALSTQGVAPGLRLDLTLSHDPTATSAAGASPPPLPSSLPPLPFHPSRSACLCPLTALDLSSNPLLGDVGVEALAQGLALHKGALRELRLARVAMGQRGILALAQALTLVNGSSSSAAGAGAGVAAGSQGGGGGGAAAGAGGMLTDWSRDKAGQDTEQGGTRLHPNRQQQQQQQRQQQGAAHRGLGTTPQPSLPPASSRGGGGAGGAASGGGGVVAGATPSLGGSGPAAGGGGGPGVTCLVLDGNRLGVAGAQALAALLPAMTDSRGLTSLSLVDCQVSSSRAAALRPACPLLGQVDMRHNGEDPAAYIPAPILSALGTPAPPPLTTYQIQPPSTDQQGGAGGSWSQGQPPPGLGRESSRPGALQPGASKAEHALMSMQAHAQGQAGLLGSGGEVAGVMAQGAKPLLRAGREGRGATLGQGPVPGVVVSREAGPAGGLTKYEAVLAQSLNLLRKLRSSKQGMQILI